MRVAHLKLVARVGAGMLQAALQRTGHGFIDDSADEKQQRMHFPSAVDLCSLTYHEQQRQQRGICQRLPPCIRFIVQNTHKGSIFHVISADDCSDDHDMQEYDGSSSPGGNIVSVSRAQ